MTNNRYSPPTSEGRPYPGLTHDSLCRFCGGLLFARTTRPFNHTVETWHFSAKCVEGDEPSRKMGGPA